MRYQSYEFTVAVLLIAICGPLSAVCGQETSHGDRQPKVVDAQEAERRKILDSDEWRRTSRTFDEWLSVQQTYGQDEVAAIKSDLQQRVAHMSPRELRDFMDEMNDRLNVLLAPEAAEARHWMQNFFANAVNPEQQLGRSRPDVLNMTASKIRQEILWLEQHRENRRREQAAFELAQSFQSQASRDAQAARQSARQGSVANRSKWPANTPRVASPYSPRREREPLRPSPVYMIGPGGSMYFRLP
jgi:hypothetical protein